MDELILTRYGLLGAVIMALMPFAIKFLNAQTDNATRHATAEDDRENIMLQSYVKSFERRESEYTTQLIEIRRAVDALPALIKQESRLILKQIKDLSDRLNGE